LSTTNGEGIPEFEIGKKEVPHSADIVVHKHLKDEGYVGLVQAKNSRTNSP
jgi:hypothetical protein